MKDAIIYILNTIGFFIIFLLIIFGLYFFLDNFGIIFQNKSFNIGEMGDLLSGTIGLIISVFTLVLVYKTFVSQREELQSQRQELIEQRNEYKITRAYDLFYKELELIQKDFDIFKENGAFRNYNELPIEYIFDGLLVSMNDFRTKVLKGDYKSITNTVFNNNFKKAFLILLRNLIKRNESINIITTGIDRKTFDNIYITKNPDSFGEFLFLFNALLCGKNESIQSALISGNYYIKINLKEIEEIKYLYKKYNECVDLENILN